MQLFHSSILKSYLQIVFLTYAIRNITMPAYSTGLLVCFYIFFLYHHCFFVCGSRIGKQIITAKKQDITDGTDASQMTLTINYFTIHVCQPYPFLIEWDSNKSNQKRHSKRYPPGSQCIFVDNISNATRSNKYQKHQKAKYPNK